MSAEHLYSNSSHVSKTEPTKKNFVKNQFNLILAYLTTLAKNVFDRIYISECLCVLMSFTWCCVLVRFVGSFTGSFESISVHIFRFDTHTAHAQPIFTNKKKIHPDSRYNLDVMSWIKQSSVRLHANELKVIVTRQAVRPCRSIVFYKKYKRKMACRIEC